MTRRSHVPCPPHGDCCNPSDSLVLLTSACPPTPPTRGRRQARNSALPRRPQAQPRRPVPRRADSAIVEKQYPQPRSALHATSTATPSCRWPRRRRRSGSPTSCAGGVRRHRERRRARRRRRAEERAGPTLLIRTDLDAPAGQGEDRRRVRQHGHGDRPRRARRCHVMHACGHDVHMTCLVGAARAMAELKDRWRGTLVLIGQPAEEVGKGAKAMLDDGLFTRFPRPDFVPRAARRRGAGGGQGRVTCRASRWPTSTRSTSSSAASAGTARSRTRRRTRSSSRRRSILALQTIASREIKPDRPGRRHGRLDPRRHEAQHHPRRGARCSSPSARTRTRCATQTLDGDRADRRRAPRRPRACRRTGCRSVTRDATSSRRRCTTRRSWSSA